VANRRLTTFIAVCLLLSAYTTGAENADPLAGWTKRKSTLGPLSAQFPVRSLTFKPEHELADGTFQAWGIDFTVVVKPDGCEINVLNTPYKFKKFPAKIDFGTGTPKYSIMISREPSGRMYWTPHYGLTVSLDNKDICIVDLDMNGVVGEATDAFCGPDSSSLLPFNGEMWSETTDYSVQVVGEGAAATLYTRPIAFPRSGRDNDLNEGWALFNYLRQRSGAGPLKWDDAIAEKCMKHCIYCCTVGALSHEEVPGRAGYTEDGAYGGMHSNLASGHPDSKSSILGLYQTAYHTSRMVAPQLTGSGMAFYKTYFAVDCRTHFEGEAPLPTEWVFPSQGMKNTWCAFTQWGEIPMPLFGRQKDTGAELGQCIMAKIIGAEYVGVGTYSLDVTDESGRKVKGELTHPGRSASLYGFNDGLIILAPYTALKPNTVFTAVLKYTIQNKDFGYVWSFKTGAAEDRRVRE